MLAIIVCFYHLSISETNSVVHSAVGEFQQPNDDINTLHGCGWRHSGLVVIMFARVLGSSLAPAYCVCACNLHVLHMLGGFLSTVLG